MTELDILEQAIKQRREDGERALVSPWDGIADAMLDVVKAADTYMDLFDPGPEDKCEEMDILRDSLAALKAKIAGIG